MQYGNRNKKEKCSGRFNAAGKAGIALLLAMILAGQPLVTYVRQTVWAENLEEGSAQMTAAEASAPAEQAVQAEIPAADPAAAGDTQDAQAQQPAAVTPGAAAVPGSMTGKDAAAAGTQAGNGKQTGENKQNNGSGQTDADRPSDADAGTQSVAEGIGEDAAAGSGENPDAAGADTSDAADVASGSGADAAGIDDAAEAVGTDAGSGADDQNIGETGQTDGTVPADAAGEGTEVTGQETQTGEDGSSEELTAGSVISGSSADGDEESDGEDGSDADGQEDEEEKDEKDKEDEDEVKMPAAEFSGAANDVGVYVSAPEGALPEGASMIVADASYAGAAAEAALSNVKDIRAVDISFYDKDGAKIDPAVPVTVSMYVSAMDVPEENAQGSVVFIDSSSLAQVISTADLEGSAVSAFFSASFSAVYALAVTGDKYPAATLVESAGGVTITVTAPEGSLPEGAKLRVIPVSAGLVSDAIDAAMESEGRELVDVVAFDITPIDRDGNDVQPRKPVTVTFSGTGLEVGEGGDVSVYCVSDDGSSAAEVGASVASEDTQQFAAAHFTIYAAAGSVQDPNADGSNQANSTTHRYVLEAGASVVLETNHPGTYSSNWLIYEGSGYVSLDSGTRTVTNTNDSNRDQNVRINHYYRNSWYDTFHTESYYIVAKAKTFKVTFMFQDAGAAAFSMEKELTVTNHSNVPAGEIPSHEAAKTVDGVEYLFSGWCADEACTTPASYRNITADKTVYAKYNRKVTLEYRANSGHDAATVPAKTEVGQGSKVVISGDAFYEGHALTGWNISPDGSGTPYAPGSEIQLDDDLILYAQWDDSKIIMRYYNNYNAGDQSQFGGDQEVEENQDVPIIAEYPEDHDGMIFLGWSTSRYGSPQYLPGENYHTGTESVNLYAVWGNYSSNQLEYQSLTAKGVTIPYDGQKHTISDVNETDYDKETRDYEGFVRVGRVGEGAFRRSIYAYVEDIIASGTNAGSYSTPMAAPLYTRVGPVFIFINEYIGVTNRSLVITPAEITVSTDSETKSRAEAPVTAGGKLTYKDGDDTKEVTLNTGETAAVVVNNETLTVNITGSQTAIGTSDNEYVIEWGSSTANKHNYKIVSGEIGKLTVYGELKFNANTTETVTGMPDNMQVSASEVTLPDNEPARDFYTFLGWARDDSAAAADVKAGEKFTLTEEEAAAGEATLYAVWQKNPVKIRFDRNTEDTVDGMPDDVEAMTADVTLPGNVPVRDFYSFLGWARDKGAAAAEVEAGGVLTLTETEIKETGEVTLYAVWEKKSVKVLFDANTTETVTGMPEDMETMKADVTMPDNEPARVFHTFLGWARDAAATEAEVKAGGVLTLTEMEIKETREVTLYAVWQEKPVEIRFDANTTETVSGMPADIRAMAAKFTIPANKPVRSGWKFLGWALKADESKAQIQPGAEYALTDEEISKGVLTFYAVWEKEPDPKPVTAVITYDLNGGMLDGQTGSVAVECEVGSTIILPTPTRDGYTFDYWEGSRYEAGDSYTVTEDHTFTAQWTEDVVPKYTITYVLNGGKLGSQTGSVTTECEDGSIIILPTPARDGYTFDYWQDQAGNRYAAGAKYTVKGPQTFTAQWKENVVPKPDDKKNNPTSAQTKAPGTGDHNRFLFWGEVLCVSMLLLFTAVSYKRRTVRARSRRNRRGRR